MTFYALHNTNYFYRRITCLILFFIFQGTLLIAQQPDTTTKRDARPFSITVDERHATGDSIRIINNDSIIQTVDVDKMEHSPSKALFYSLFLPGLGQAYNKKYWKIPIVYGAYVGVGFWIRYNTLGYRNASNRYADDPNSLNERYLRAWRRNLELSYITLVAAHALQVLDAYVDANLFYWDVNPELTLRVSPAIEPIVLPSYGPVANYGLKWSFKF